MAQRENFIITTNTGLTVVKHKWNSANREVENMIREIAKSEHTIYNLVDSVSIKDGDFNYHIKGSRTWQGNNGNTVIFNIEKE